MENYDRETAAEGQRRMCFDNFDMATVEAEVWQRGNRQRWRHGEIDKTFW